MALWLFDEQIGIYPSCFLTDAGPNDYSVVLGRGGRIVEGKYGNALEPAEPFPIKQVDQTEGEGLVKFGLSTPGWAKETAVEPLTWKNAFFTAFYTTGEKHLRKRDFVNPTSTDLNLGDFDWTVEFWYRTTGEAEREGVVFEVGNTPQGISEEVTRLSLGAARKRFLLLNSPSQKEIQIGSDPQIADGRWRHLAFSYDSKLDRVRHWVDGELKDSVENVDLKRLPDEDEAYFSIGRDGAWERPLPGRLDELRFSKGAIESDRFEPPGSFSKAHGPDYQSPTLLKGPPLLFEEDEKNGGAVPIGSRRHLFIDDRLIEKSKDVEWTVNPPFKREVANIPIHGHLSVLQDEEGLIRIYGSGPRRSLAVFTSRDGINFEQPDLGKGAYGGKKNVVIRDRVGLGQVFIDPNAPPEERWKYLTGVREQGVYVYTSPDGWTFKRNETAALPFWAGSQSNIFYDDQRQIYVAFHRSDYGKTPRGKTERRFVMTEVKDPMKPWPFNPVTPEKTKRLSNRLRFKSDRTNPWFLDNGPMAPGGFGIEYPIVFMPDYNMDPIPTDIYIPKAVKYPWAPDTYLAFPHLYFHYWEADPPEREILGEEERGRGSGVVEVQTMTSRNGKDWKRYPRPAYVGLANDRDVGRYHMARMVQGVIRRGDEIWQYHQTLPYYHSRWEKEDEEGGKAGLFRLIQRLDGFISADAAYTGGELRTRPVIFDGDRLVLNVDTEATGYAQVGFLDESGAPIPGFSVDDCIFINGDYLRAQVEWMEKGKDVSSLAGKVVQLVFRMRGTKLYSMQFVSG